MGPEPARLRAGTRREDHTPGGREGPNACLGTGRPREGPVRRSGGRIQKQIRAEPSPTLCGDHRLPACSSGHLVVRGFGPPRRALSARAPPCLLAVLSGFRSVCLRYGSLHPGRAGPVLARARAIPALAASRGTGGTGQLSPCLPPVIPSRKIQSSPTPDTVHDIGHAVCYVPHRSSPATTPADRTPRTSGQPTKRPTTMLKDLVFRRLLKKVQMQGGARSEG